MGFIKMEHSFLNLINKVKTRKYFYSQKNTQKSTIFIDKNGTPNKEKTLLFLVQSLHLN